jgi:RNase adaptor protein for sRNA GlmZ degradation
VPILDFSNSEESLKIYNYFKRNNLPVTSWPDLANEIFQDEENHLVAINMRKNKIFLSIHHTLDVTKYNYKWL